MWSRLSLRLQIVVILLLVLGAQALLGTLWLALVLPRTLASSDAHVAQAVLESTAQELLGECGMNPEPSCARNLLELAMSSGMFRGISARSGSGAALATGTARRRDVTADLGQLHLEAELELSRARKQTGSLLQFHLANLAAVTLVLLVLGTALFNRTVVKPVDQLAGVADRIGHLELDELGAATQTPMLGQLSASFERMSRALRREQSRVGAQISELTRVNKELQDARDAIVRQEKLATVGRLAAGVAHEVGNPLGGILGYAELLKASADPATQDYGARIEREVARIDRTVRGLLDFSRPSQAELAPISLANGIQRALSLCQADKRFREVRAEVALPPELPNILADEHRLGQVLVNLLLNAGDAMGGKGAVKLHAEVGRDDRPHRRASDPPPGARVILFVDDTGPGIPPDVLPRIFDPFFTTKEVGQGTGLGLSICASIMDAFGGELRAENLPGGGARFRCVFRAG